MFENNWMCSNVTIQASEQKLIKNEEDLLIVAKKPERSKVITAGGLVGQSPWRGLGLFWGLWLSKTQFPCKKCRTFQTSPPQFYCINTRIGQFNTNKKIHTKLKQKTRKSAYSQIFLMPDNKDTGMIWMASFGCLKFEKNSTVI